MNLNKIFDGGLTKHAVNECNGQLIPLIFDYTGANTVAPMNPSVYNDSGQLRCNVRGANYVMGHSELNKFPHWNGPLQYIHPENDVRLATDNWILDLDDELNIIKVRFCDMRLNIPAKWEFHGLEDGRLVRWNDKLYLTGVRRDTTDNGEGRMELSEFILEDNVAAEISRVRIPSTGNNDSYCEKNWMPVLDQPYTYVKWSNPIEVVRFNPDTKILEVLPNQSWDPRHQYVRGGTQVVHYKNYYIAFGHSVDIWKPYSGEKDSNYNAHVFIWDENFNIIKISDPFKYINAKIEFACGLCLDNSGNMLVSFSEMDNTAFLLKFNPDWLINEILKS